jgi:hypothetical protein
VAKEYLTTEKLNEIVNECFSGMADDVGKVWVDHMEKTPYLRVTLQNGYSRLRLNRVKLLRAVLESMTHRRFVTVVYGKDMTWEETNEITSRIWRIGEVA